MTTTLQEKLTAAETAVDDAMEVRADTIFSFIEAHDAFNEAVTKDATLDDKRRKKPSETLLAQCAAASSEVEKQRELFEAAMDELVQSEMTYRQACKRWATIKDMIEIAAGQERRPQLTAGGSTEH
jgi:hypothetical protein